MAELLEEALLAGMEVGPGAEVTVVAEQAQAEAAMAVAGEVALLELMLAAAVAVRTVQARCAPDTQAPGVC